MTRPRSLRRARATACMVLGLIAASTLLGSSARAQTDDEAPAGSSVQPLGGYQGRAHSSGIHLFYNPQGVLPTAAILDVGTPDALATIASGPATFARASIADPGDLLVNPDALLTQADPSYPSGSVPAYPFRISANSTVGAPSTTQQPAPGLESRVQATPEGSTAESVIASSDAPGIASIGSVRSHATTTFDGATVTVKARTVVSNFELLGVLAVNSIITDVTATSSGGDTNVEGSTEVSGATFMGQPVIIDEEGIRTDPEADKPTLPLLGPIGEALPADLSKALEDVGIRISLPGPVVQDGQTAGTIGSTGLRIDFELSERTAPVLGQLLGALPSLDSPVPGAPSPADVIVLLRATHLAAIDVGRAEASLTTRPAFVAPPFEASDTGATPSVGASTPIPALSPPIARTPGLPPAPAGSPAAGAPAAPAVPLETAPAASLAAGIGALALLALLAQPFLGDRLARAGAAVLATGPTDTCPLEER